MPPTGQSRFSRNRRGQSVREVEDKFNDQNRIAAAVILAAPKQYGGETAGLVRWARMVTARMATEQAVAGDQAQLFDRAGGYPD
jgi:hypothetical protein